MELELEELLIKIIEQNRIDTNYKLPPPPPDIYTKNETITDYDPHALLFLTYPFIYHFSKISLDAKIAELDSYCDNLENFKGVLPKLSYLIGADNKIKISRKMRIENEQMKKKFHETVPDFKDFNWVLSLLNYFYVLAKEWIASMKMEAKIKVDDTKRVAIKSKFWIIERPEDIESVLGKDGGHSVSIEEIGEIIKQRAQTKEISSKKTNYKNIEKHRDESEDDIHIGNIYNKS